MVDRVIRYYTVDHGVVKEIEVDGVIYVKAAREYLEFDGFLWYPKKPYSNTGKRKYTAHKPYTVKSKLVRYINRVGVGKTFTMEEFCSDAGVDVKNVYRYKDMLDRLDRDNKIEILGKGGVYKYYIREKVI